MVFGNIDLSACSLGNNSALVAWGIVQLSQTIADARTKIVVSEEMIGSEIGPEDCVKTDLCMICEFDFEGDYSCNFKYSNRCPGNRTSEFDVYRRTFYYKKSPDDLLTEEFRVVRTVIDSVCR